MYIIVVSWMWFLFAKMRGSARMFLSGQLPHHDAMVRGEGGRQTATLTTTLQSSHTV